MWLCDSWVPVNLSLLFFGCESFGEESEKTAECGAKLQFVGVAEQRAD